MDKTILICTPDGNQRIETITCDPDPIAPDATPADPQADTDALIVDHELRITLLELGGI